MKAGEDSLVMVKMELKDYVDNNIHATLEAFKNGVNRMEVLCSDVQFLQGLMDPLKDFVDVKIVIVQEEEAV